MAKCPNIKHPDWIALEKKHGENGAWKKYIENNYEIPSIENGNVKSKEPISINKVFNGVRDLFSAKSTLDTIDKHPDMFKRIVDNLKRLYPDIRIQEDYLFDEDGNVVNIPPGKVGMHYRSALTSAIAYANDAYMETVPHEYVHEYIDMFRNTDIIRKAIDKYGEERLVTLIGRKYTGQQMSNSFEKFLNDFWKMVKGIFSSPSVIDELTDAFAKNERLGTPLSRGTAIYNYQDIAKPLSFGKNNISDFNEDIEAEAKDLKEITNDEVAQSIEKELISEFAGNNQEEVLDRFGAFWTRTARGIAGIKDDNRKTKNIAPVDESIVAYVNDVLPNNRDNKIALAKKFVGEDVKLTSEQQRIYDNILRLRKGIMHHELIKDSYIDGDKVVNKEVVDKINLNDVQKQSEKIKENLKSKNKFLRWSAELLTKGLQYVANTRMWANYLSGSENSLFSEITVKGLLNGRISFSDYYFKFNDIVSGISTSLKEHSTFHNKKNTIEDFETTTIVLDKNINKDSSIDELQLTKTELLNIYLLDRREGGRYNLTKNGIRPENIEGRDINLDYAFRLTDDQVDNVNALIKNDADMMEAVAKIDEAMELGHNMLNPIHKKLNGFDLEKHENYFPVFHGKHTGGKKKEKNVIENQRSFRMYVPEGGGPVKLEDPFKTLSNLQMANATYIGYAIPIHNAQLTLNSLKGNFSKKDSRERMYIEQLEGTLQKIQDPSLLYSTQGEDKTSRLMSKVQGNFTVATLAMNVGVIFKQQLSLTTAEMEINSKFLRQAGTSLGPFNIINPIDLFRQLSLTGKETMLPVEWKNQINDKDYQELLNNDPLMRERFSGLISTESGEAIMSKDSAEDKIKIPFLKKNGKAVYMSKARVMMGITMMDSLAIIRIYKAVKLETESRMNEPGFSNLTEEQILAHNLARLQEIVDKTQPTFDQINRTGLARDSNPLVRALTMFTSATSKMSMELIDSMIDVNQNYSKQNLLKLLGRVNNLGVKTAVQLVLIDMIWQGLRGGWDEDEWEKLPEKMLLTGVMSTAGSTQGVGTALGMFLSQLDSQPWTRTLQDPTQIIVQEAMNASANLAKGNIGKAAKQGSQVVFKTLGVPTTPLTFTSGWVSKLTEN